MADHGAEVIKIEPPGTGDSYRTLKIVDGRETSKGNLSMSWKLVRNIHELADDPQLAAAGAVFQVHLRNGAVMDVCAGPMSFDGVCAPAQPSPSPDLGQDSDAILTEIGYGDGEIARLRAELVVG